MFIKLLRWAWCSQSNLGQGRRRPVRRSYRPQGEALEDRLTMSANPVIHVTTFADELTAGDGKLSLREAITLANSRPGPDTIVLPAGTFKMQLAGAGENGNLTGDFDINEG